MQCVQCKYKESVLFQWLEEHQFIDSLVQIICGTYAPEPLPPADLPEKGQRERSEKELAPADNRIDHDGYTFICH